MNHDSENILPILVLGIGNTLLSDDGAGLALLEELQKENWNGKVEFVDGGTQGLALLNRIGGRRLVLFVDAVARGAEPGTVHTMTGEEVMAGPASGTTAHETGARELLAAAMLTGDLPEQVRVVGIEPESLHTSVGLSHRVQSSLSEAAAQARSILNSFLKE